MNSTIIREPPLVNKNTRDLRPNKPIKRPLIGTPKKAGITYSSNINQYQKQLLRNVQYNLARELNEVANLKEYQKDVINSRGRQTNPNFFFSGLNTLMPQLINRVVNESVAETQTEQQPTQQPQIDPFANIQPFEYFSNLRPRPMLSDYINLDDLSSREPSISGEIPQDYLFIDDNKLLFVNLINIILNELENIIEPLQKILADNPTNKENDTIKTYITDKMGELNKLINEIDTIINNNCDRQGEQFNIMPSSSLNCLELIFNKITNIRNIVYEILNYLANKNIQISLEITRLFESSLGILLNDNTYKQLEYYLNNIERRLEDINTERELERSLVAQGEPSREGPRLGRPPTNLANWDELFQEIPDEPQLIRRPRIVREEDPEEIRSELLDEIIQNI